MENTKEKGEKKTRKDQPEQVEPRTMAESGTPIPEIRDETQELIPITTIKAEANLANFPFFALSRQDAARKTKTEYRVTVERDGQRLDALWRVTANVAYGYPHPFDRKIHKAHENHIRSKVDIFDWIQQNQPDKIKENPAGFLRRMIEEDWPPPEGFISRIEEEERNRRATARQQELQNQEDARRAAEAQAAQARQQRQAASPYKIVWEQVASHLEQKLPRQSFCTWIQPLFIAEVREGAVIIDCPSRFIKEYVEEKYRSVIEEAVTAVCSESKHVMFVCEDTGHA